MARRTLTMLLLALLSGCGLFSDMVTRRVTPPKEILVSPGGSGEYRLTLAHEAEGRGGNIHDPSSMAKYESRECDRIFVNSTAGRVEGQHIRLDGATGPFRGFISLEGESATVQFAIFQYGGPEDGKFKPYRYNGTYPTKPVSKEIADKACGKP